MITCTFGLDPNICYFDDTECFIYEDGTVDCHPRHVAAAPLAREALIILLALVSYFWYVRWRR